MPRGFTDHQTQAIDQKLILYAISMIKETGVRKTTIEKLTQAANISVGAFYNFYPSKESLFFKVYEILEDRIKEQLITFVSTTTALSLTILKNGLVTLLESEDMRNLITLIRKDELDYLLMNIDPLVIQNHLLSDQFFVKQLLGLLSERGLSTKIEEGLVLAYAQALINLCYDKDQLQPYSDRIIDSFINTLLFDLFTPSPEKNE